MSAASSTIAAQGMPPVPPHVPARPCNQLGSVSVCEFGAIGHAAFDVLDPPPDSTDAFQEAMDHAASHPGTTVIVPPLHYHIGRVTLADATNVRVVGPGATLHMFLAEGESPISIPNREGLELRGACTDILIDGLTFIGDADPSSRQAGVWARSAPTTLDRVRITHVSVESASLGIALDMTSSTSHARRVVIDSCFVTDIVATDDSTPGEGYGYQVANGSDGYHGVTIRNCIADDCDRHSIYVALGRGYDVVRNLITRHRHELDTGAVRPAINIARSSDVDCSDNWIIDHVGTAIAVGAELAGETADRVRVHRNVIAPSEMMNETPQIEVGPDVAVEGTIGYVEVVGNVGYFDGLTSAGFIRCNRGDDIEVRENRLFAINGGPTTTMVELFARDGGSSDQSWRFERNRARIHSGGPSSSFSGRMFRANPLWESSSIRTTFVDNVTREVQLAFNEASGTLHAERIRVRHDPDDAAPVDDSSFSLSGAGAGATIVVEPGSDELSGRLLLTIGSSPSPGASVHLVHTVPGYGATRRALVLRNGGTGALSHGWTLGDSQLSITLDSAAAPIVGETYAFEWRLDE